MLTKMNLSYLLDWQGQPESRTLKVETTPVAMWLALLDLDGQLEHGSPVPPLAHWAVFAPIVRQSELGSDGHPKRGSFLPPVPLPRRMWAGGQLEFHRPLSLGEEIVRLSEVKKIEGKKGSSGELVFVSVHHRISASGDAVITEIQDIVYRSAHDPSTPPRPGTSARTDENFSREFTPDPMLLFRYSAATFNTHRIHYDRKYATEVEGYPGLVVHGPLVATLLLELLRGHRPSWKLKHFEFKAVAPVFDNESVTLCGRVDGAGEAALWVRNSAGLLCMEALAKP